MKFLYLFLGLSLYAGTLADLIKTTFSSTGGGWITNGIAKAVWRSFFVISGRQGRSRLLPYAGPTILVLILGPWILGLWLSFFFVLLSDPLSIKHGSTGAPADNLEKLYYAAFTLSTLGVGDFVAANNLWRTTTGLAAFSGLAFITASITYIGPVLSAIGHQSRLALYIHSLGATPQQILVNSWNGQDFSRLYDQIPDLCKMVLQHTLNHHSYPVIHYFHNSRPEFAIAPSVDILHEVL
ncbi:MAG: potassium channel family protein [Bacteroidetes bacterium]|nr:potassium channel family protein [Bacteroidota bacterium]